MNEFGKQIIFRQLLERHQRIQIPMIQRDYAQGREEVKEVREEFLNALHSALLLPTDDKSLPLNLDFIYGSVEGDSETCFLPLDGQQRLTTLFLLHWYLAWQDDRLEDFQAMVCLPDESRFSYHVRPSGTEFFNALVNYTPNLPAKDVSSLRELITDQSWYFRYWRLDPTIQSSITMLDSIHDHFCESEGFFSRLIDEEQPAITFQLLDLENFGLSDDLYIKMNARGKPLTAFETFKARYEQELERQFVGETRKIDDLIFPVTEYFARRMDTQWADFFWSHRDRQTNLYDDAVMNLFRLVALVTRNPKSDTYVKGITILRNRRLKPSFSLFYEHEWLDREFSETLFLLLESWSADGEDFARQLPDAHYYDEIAFFTKAVNEPASLSSIEIVQFAAYVVFMREHDGEVDSQAFQEWMRIFFNLSVNTSYDRPEDVQRSIAGILKLAPNCGDILAHFSSTNKPATGFNEQQIAEERLKAELILVDVDWRPLIDRAERHGYFRGQIEFLLDFSGVSDKWKESGDVNWDAGTHITLQNTLENYLAKAEIMFNARGLATLAEYHWERVLLSIGDYTLPSGPNHSFLVNPSTDPVSWKRLLRDAGKNRRLLQQLWDRLIVGKSIEEQLDAIINSATGLETWRELLVRTPEAIKYCDKRAFRWIDENKVYLMSKSQMNGMHAELFTYCLYHNSLEKLVNDDGLSPLDFISYREVNVTDSEPHIRLTVEHGNYWLVFEVKYSRGLFIIRIGQDSTGEITIIQDLLRDKLDFMDILLDFHKTSDIANIQSTLIELAQCLASFLNEGETGA